MTTAPRSPRRAFRNGSASAAGLSASTARHRPARNCRPTACARRPVCGWHTRDARPRRSRRSAATRPCTRSSGTRGMPSRPGWPVVPWRGCGSRRRTGHESKVSYLENSGVLPAQKCRWNGHKSRAGGNQNDSGLAQGLAGCLWQADRETDRADPQLRWSLLVAPAPRGGKPHARCGTPRLHHAARRRGSRMAARGGRAARRAHTARWRAPERRRWRPVPADGGKWLETLKQLVPRAAQVALIVNPENPNVSIFLRSVDTVAANFGVKTFTTAVRNEIEIEGAIAALAAKPIDGLIVLPDALALVHSQRIVGLAARHRLPVVYPFRDFVVKGGLVSYGIRVSENYRQAAEYVDRILRGAKPADLPVQAPTKFELVLNLRTAKTLGLDVPLHLQQLADEVIE